MPNGILKLPERLHARMMRENGTWYGRYGHVKKRAGITLTDVLKDGYTEKVSAYLTQTPLSWQRIVTGTWEGHSLVPLTVGDSLATTVEGIQSNLQRERNMEKKGMAFKRVAGQAVIANDPSARTDIRRLLEKTKKDGVFVILGHGGMYPCGAVAARKAQLNGAAETIRREEHRHTIRLLENISPDVQYLGSPGGEWHNATMQGIAILKDPEFAEIVKRRNITIVYAIAVNNDPVIFAATNADLTHADLCEKYPKLKMLAAQLEKSTITAAAEDKGSRHFAHAIVLYDPLDMMSVLAPDQEELEVSGIICVDARLTPGTLDNILRGHVGEFFFVGANATNGVEIINPANGGSISYALRHVGGVNILNKGGITTGNGHIVALATNPERAAKLRNAISTYDDTKRVIQMGGSITVITFDGREARIINEKTGFEKTISARTG